MKHQVLFCAHCHHPFNFRDEGLKRMPNGVLAYHHLDGCNELSELAPATPTPDGGEAFMVVGPITANPDGG